MGWVRDEGEQGEERETRPKRCGGQGREIKGYKAFFALLKPESMS